MARQHRTGLAAIEVQEAQVTTEHLAWILAVIGWGQALAWAWVARFWWRAYWDERKGGAR